MTKKVAVVVSLLAIASVGALVWAILSTNKLIETRYELSSTQVQLALTTSELEETEDRLADTENKLTSTENELSSTKSELASTKSELVSTRNELTATKSELTNAENELASTKDELTSTESELSSTQLRLSIAQETLRGLGITLLASQECGDVTLVDNAAATHPTWAQLMAFLYQDRTDTNTYIKNVYDCSEFSRDVHNNAEAAGIRAAEVHIDFRGMSEGHALNAFLTTDYGLVYVDCTGGPDTVARVKAGKAYRAVELYRIIMANIRNDYWWDTLNSYYYLRSGWGGEAVTSSIRIYW